jgi:putative ABC transport system substrate-binding protein
LLFALVCSAAFGSADEGWAQAKLPRVGVLFFSGATQALVGQNEDALTRTLAAHGWIEGKNLVLERRTAVGAPPQFDEPAAELVRRNVDIICADSAPAARAAYAATRTIPIVALDFTNDPVAAGYVESYSRPGGNITGIFLDAPEFATKWLELLKAVIPRLSRVAVLWDPSPGATHLNALKAAAPAFGVNLQVLEVRKPEDIDRVFAALPGRPQALIILPSPMTWAQSARLAELAKKHRLLATSMAPQFTQSGGALTYGPDLTAAIERLAVILVKVLSGAKPADLPVERPSKIELVVNLPAFKALGLTVPDSVLLRADRVLR